MSLKITNAEGFTIGGVLNPSIDTIYVRCNVDMNKQKPITDENDVITEVSISTNAKTTVEGGLFDSAISVDVLAKLCSICYRYECTVFRD
jgi:hypothetical protein